MIIGDNQNDCEVCREGVVLHVFGELAGIGQAGYRSFMGVNAALMPRLYSGCFAREVIKDHVVLALKGRLVPISQQYRPADAR